MKENAFLNDYFECLGCLPLVRARLANNGVCSAGDAKINHQFIELIGFVHFSSAPDGIMFSQDQQL